MKLNLFKWRMLLTLIGGTEHRERNRISSTSIWSGWAGNRILNRRSMVRKGFASCSRRYSTCSPPERKQHPPPCDGWCCWWPPIRTSSARCSNTSTTSYLTAMNRLWNTGRCKLNGMQMRSRDWTCRSGCLTSKRSSVKCKGSAAWSTFWSTELRKKQVHSRN